MRFRKLLRYATLLLIISLNIGCDQISKTVVRNNVDYNARIPLLDEHVILTKVENSGAFLSLGDTLPPAAKNILLLALPLVILLLAAGWLFRYSSLDQRSTLALCCIIGGGMGNLFDRLVYGSVTDFLYLHYGIFKTGIFNGADVSITLGTMLLIGQHFYHTSKALPRT